MKIAKIRRIRKIVYFMPLLGLLLYIHAHKANTPPREEIQEFLDTEGEFLILLQVLYFIVFIFFLFFLSAASVELRQH